MSYIDILKNSALEAGNIVCMGLDPILSTLPWEEKGTRENCQWRYSSRS